MFPATKSIFLADINMAVLSIGRSFRLPDLVVSDTVVFTGGGTGVAALPADYHHSLFEATSTTNNTESVRIRTNIKVMNQEYADTKSKIGRIEDVAENGSNLHCLPVPVSDENLLIRFYRKPATLVDDTDIPEGMPNDLQEALLVGYVVKNKFPLVSDQPSLALQRYVADHEAAREALRIYCQHSPQQKPFISRKYVWF